MNKELREEMEFLITCDDKAITPDVRDDVEMTLKYIDKLEKENKELKDRYEKCKKQKIKVEDACSNYKYRMDKAIEYFIEDLKTDLEHYKYLQLLLRGEDNE